MANSSIKSGQAGNQLKNAMTNLLKPTKAQAEAMVNLGYISQETFKEIDFSKVESAQIAVEKAENSVKKAQMSLDTAIEKYGKNSKQAAQASLTLENAKLSLQAANGKLEKAEDGVSKKLNKNNQLMTNSDGSMKSLKEIMDALRVTLNKTGVDLVDAEGNTREFDDIIKELTQSEEGLAQAKQLESVATIFGKRNMTGMLAIVNASDEDYQKLTNSIYNCNWEVDKLSDELQNSGISWDKYSDKGWAAGKDIGDVCTLMGGEIAQMIQKTGGNAEKLEDVIKIVAGKYGMTMEDARKAVEATQKGIENSSGEAERTAKKMIDNLKGSITLLKDGVIDFGISIGKILMPKVKAVIEKLQDFVNWLNGLNDAQKETIVKIATVVAAIGPVLLVVSKVTGAISGGLNVVKSLTTTFGKLLINMKYAHGPLDAVGKLFGGISGKVVAVVGVIAVLAAAFIHLWKNNEEFREKMTEIWERLKEVVSNFVSHFSESWDRLITALQPILEALKNLWDGFCNALAPVFEGAFSIIVSVLEVATDAITAALDIIAQLFTGDFQGAIDTFVGFFEGALDAIGDILYTIFDTVGEFLGRLWDAFHSNPVLGALTDLLCAPFALAKAAIEAIFPEVDGLSSFGVKVEYIFRSVYHAVVDNWKKIGPFFAGVWKTITEKFDGIKDTIIKKWTEAKQKISEIADGMKTAISKKWEEIKTNAATYFEGIKNNIVNEWNRTREEINTCIENIKKVISEKWAAISKSVSGVFENIRNAAVTKWQNVVTNVTLAVALIRESLIKTFGNIQTNVINAWTNIRNAMTNPIESAKRIIHNAIETMKGFFNFNWSLPKIKLPHFSISGSFSLNPPSIPHFSVEWYRKAMESGMILNSPTIFGVQGNTLLGGGDAGPEAVIGVDSLRNMISEEIRNAGNQARDLTVIFKLKDDTELGRAVYRMYNEESQRVGVRLANV
jgi:phage-related protein